MRLFGFLIFIWFFLGLQETIYFLKHNAFEKTNMYFHKNHNCISRDSIDLLPREAQPMPPPEAQPVRGRKAQVCLH